MDELLYTQEDIDEWIRTCEELQERNRELEQEIAELEKELDKAYETERANIQAEIADAGTSCHWCRNATVKDVAKNILQELSDFVDYETFREGFELVKVKRKIKDIAKDKGVEVE